MSFKVRDTEAYEETHASTGRTCKVHTEKPQSTRAGFEPPTILAVMRRRRPINGCPIQQDFSQHSLMISFTFLLTYEKISTTLMSVRLT